MSKLSAADRPGGGALRKLATQLRRPFVRDTGVLQAGNFATIGLNFLVSVALARLLGRDVFGGYALVLSTITTISLFKRLGQDFVATTTLARAYAQRDAKAARGALVVFNVINLWSTLAVIPLALILAPQITTLFYGDAELAEPLRLALLPPIWAMLTATTVIVLQCTRRLATLTLMENGHILTAAIGGLCLVLMGGGLSAFFLGWAIASLAFAGLAVAIYRRLALREKILPSLRQLVFDVMGTRPAWIGREFRTGVAVALDKNLASLYPLAPILLLGSQAPTQEVALLRVAMSYAAVPLLTTGAVSRALMVKLPELHATQPQRMRRFFLQVTSTGGGISILVTLPFILLAPWLIGLVYGPDFGAAAHLVPLLALDPLLAGFGIAAGPVLRTYRRNIWAVYANLAILAVGLPLAYFLTQTYSMQGAALSYALLVTILRVISYGLCLRIVSGNK